MSGYENIFEVSPRRPDVAQHADIDQADAAFSKRGCCFRWIPLLSPREPSSSSSALSVSYEEPWWTRGWKKMRDWSEKVAGPKWKTFIRRFWWNRGNGRYATLGGSGVAPSQFRYDPTSYAMNFDDGHDDHLDDGEALRRDFSSRYALPVSCKSSMDLGKGGGPLFL